MHFVLRLDECKQAREKQIAAWSLMDPSMLAKNIQLATLVEMVNRRAYKIEKHQVMIIHYLRFDAW